LQLAVVTVVKMWINIKDKLPEPNKGVLIVWCHDTIAAVHTIRYKNKIEFVYSSHYNPYRTKKELYNSFRYTNKVTYWQYLPELPMPDNRSLTTTQSKTASPKLPKATSCNRKR